MENESKIKRFKSAYLFYFEKAKLQIKNEYPTIKYRDLLKEIGKRWIALSTEEKKEYYELERIDKEKFISLKRTQTYTYNSSTKPKKPKRFRTAFMIFLHEKKEEIDKENVVKSLKEIGQEWKNLPNIVKQYYKEKENEDKLRYQKEYSIYTERLIKQKENKKTKKDKYNEAVQLANKLYSTNTDEENNLN